MIKRSRSDAALVVECARLHGVSPRAVRDWRKNQDARWGAFIHSQAKQSSFLPAAVDMQPILTLEQEEEGAARRYAALSALADAAISRQDTALLPGLLKSAGEAHSKLHKVRENVRNTRAAEGSLVPRDQAFAAAESLVHLLRRAVVSLPDDVLPDLESENPEMVRGILTEWVGLTLEEIAEQVAALESRFPLAVRQAAAALGFEMLPAEQLQEDVP